MGFCLLTLVYEQTENPDRNLAVLSGVFLIDGPFTVSGGSVTDT